MTTSFTNSNYPMHDRFVDAMIAAEAIDRHYLSDTTGSIPNHGIITLNKPRDPHEDTEPYEVDARLLHRLSAHFSKRGLRGFQYLNHGQHAIIFTAYNPFNEQKNLPTRIVLRVHLGETLPRDCPDVFKARRSHSIHQKNSQQSISYDEMEFFHIPGPNAVNPKILVGLGISCLANGYFFNDPHGGNVALREGEEERVGVLESHAVEDIRQGSPSYQRAILGNFVRDMNAIRKTRNAYRNMSIKRMDEMYRQQDEEHHNNPEHISYRNLSVGQKRGKCARDWDSKEYGSGDVIHTLSHLVLLLDGHYFDSRTAGSIKEHPMKEERKEETLRLLKHFQLPYFTMGSQNEFILVPLEELNKEQSEQIADMADEFRHMLRKLDRNPDEQLITDLEEKALALPTSQTHRQRIGQAQSSQQFPSR